MGRPLGSTDGKRPEGGYPRVGAPYASFLAGLIEGEACFGVRKQPRNTNHSCAMTLTLRDDDRALIDELAALTGLGKVTRRAARGTQRAQAAWSVMSKADCVRLVEILIQTPLRGRKGRDFALWAAAVRWWTAGDPTRRQIHRDWAPMVYIKHRLHEARRFDPEPPPILDDRDVTLSQDWVGYLSGLMTAEG